MRGFNAMTVWSHAQNFVHRFNAVLPVSFLIYMLYLSVNFYTFKDRFSMLIFAQSLFTMNPLCSVSSFLTLVRDHLSLLDHAVRFRMYSYMKVEYAFIDVPFLLQRET